MEGRLSSQQAQFPVPAAHRKFKAVTELYFVHLTGTVPHHPVAGVCGKTEGTFRIAVIRYDQICHGSVPVSRAFHTASTSALFIPE